MRAAPASICADELPFGVLGRPHGVSGELVFRPYHAQGVGIDAFQLPLSATLGRPGEPESVLIGAARKTAQGFLVRFEGVSSREDAARLTGREVLIRRAALPPLAGKEFYVEDLVGCVVQDLKGKVLGIVSGLYWNGAQDVMSLDGGAKCIPVVSKFIVEVNFAEKMVKVDFDD